MGFKRVSLCIPGALPSTGSFDQGGVTRWFARALEVRRPSHERLFAQYLEAYRIAEGTANELRSRLASVDDGIRYPGDMAIDFKILEQRRIDVSVAAENLLVPLDAMLGGLRFRLFGSDVCKDHGPILRNDKTVDRALDAIGNYVRHAFEWFSHDYHDTQPTAQQERSIKPLAQIYTSRPITDAEDAYEEFTLIPLPPAFVLDLLADYEMAGPRMTYRTVEAKVYAAALKSIECRFAGQAARG
jgi:hypothetical protein